MHSTSRAIAFVGALAVLNCGKPAPPPPPAQAPRSTAPVAVTATSIDVGRSVAADKSIADRTETFASTDTFYVAVHTAGASPSTTLIARWTFGDQLVTESSQTIAPDGPAVTEFHASGPTGGWPKGDYKVEVFLNGVSAGTKTFSVK